jgi:chemotaxis protein methyltransferase CheR
VSNSGSKGKKFDGIARGPTLSSGTFPGDKGRILERKKVTDRVFPDESNILFKQVPDHEKLGLIIRYLVSQGIKVDYYKEKYIARRLRVRMGRLNITTYLDYLSYLKKNTSELIILKESLSINVTRFFRNKDTFDILQEKIFPRIINEHKKSEYNIWSAGCAVGAEPYTVSIIAGEYLSKHGVSTRILATDVNEDLLKIARSAIYTPPYLAEMSEADAKKYFRLTIEGNYEVNPVVKSRVNFSRQDLTKDTYPTGFDLIICRNVLIYIDKDAQEEIISKFVNSLNPGGLLILGRTETLLGVWKNKLTTISGIHRIYQKVDSTIPELKIDDKPMASKTDKLKQKLRMTVAESNFETINPKKEIKPRKNYQESITQSNQRVQDRLAELRDFRERFEERKRLWEERMETKKSSSRSSSFGALSKASDRTSTSKTNPVESEPNLNRNFRSLLRPVNEPIRESRIRKDNPVGNKTNRTKSTRI